MDRSLAIRLAKAVKLPVITRLIRVTLGLALGGMLVFGVIAPASAQTQEVAKLLRVEWEPGSEKWGPPRLVGYVYNDSTYRIGSVRLRVETLDGSDRVTGETLAWIYVSVPAKSRAYFSIRRPSGAEAFRLGVESFVLISKDAEQTP